ncbi:alpha/beta fold hydrolase [Pseudomonas sp. NPDC090755]|uniref:alpha/beta fold hydrolase n=1 Tax=Pseudomonas sp. NPDC090755 TaxID=3364481 RepID=UPI00383B937D
MKTALLAAVVGISASASASTPTVQPKPTVVLVHGAFADGSTWNNVIPLLQAKGLNVVSVQNPLSSLEDDVAATRRALDAQKGPVVLVGHSWGGMVITQAGQHENVKSLVYIAAFAPSEGESVADLSKAYPTPTGLTHIVADKEGFLTLTPEGIEKHLAADVSSDQTRLMIVTQTPIRGSSFEQKVTAAAWKTRPSWYLLSEQDHMIQPELQAAMAKKISAQVTRLAADHVPHLSKPEAVAEIILKAVDKTPQ